MSALRKFLAAVILLLFPASSFAAEKAFPVGFAGVQADGFAVLSVNVAQLWDEPALKSLRDGIAKLHAPLKDLEKHCGIKLEELERVTLYCPMGSFIDHISQPCVIYTARKPFDRAAAVKKLGAEPVGDSWPGVSGKNVFVVKEGALIFADDRTLVTSPRGRNDSPHVAGFLKVLSGITARVTEGAIEEGILAAPKHSVIVAVDFAPIRKLLGNEVKLPDELQPFLAMAQAERGLFTFDVGPTVKVESKLTFFNADNAKKAEPDAKAILGLALNIMEKFRNDKNRDREADDVLLPLFDFAKTALDKANRKVDGQTLSVTASGEIDPAMKKALAAMPDRFIAEQVRMTASNNMKQIALAMHNHHDSMGEMPRDITDKDGKAILSWRVHLLPFMEQTPLWKQLDLTKSWDDPANSKFVELMPDVYKFPSREPTEKGFTYFQSFTAPKLVKASNPFMVPGRKLEIVKISDGTSNTLFIVDGETAVNWLKPGDLPYDPKTLPKIGNPKTGKFLGGMGDGSVRTFDLKKLGDKNLHALITIDGGEVVKFDE